MTMSIDSARQTAGRLPGRLTVPWFTVLLLAAVMAFADGFWMLSMRGATGAIERSDGAFTSWWRESIVGLPVFVVAVLGAMLLAVRLFGPVLDNFKAVAGSVLLVALAGTVVGIAETAVSSAYDYYLQAGQLQMIESMHGLCTDSCLAQAQQSSFDLQVRAVLFASGLMLVTNVVLVGWLVAIRGGRLTIATVERRPDPTIESSRTGASRVDDVRLLLVVGLLGTAHVHAAQIPVRLGNWPAAAGFFLLLTAAEVAVAGLLLTRTNRAVLLAAAAISTAPILVFLYACTVGLPFGPHAGVRETLSVPGCLACALELLTLLAACWLLRGTAALSRRPAVSEHLRALIVAAVVAVTVIGLAGTAPAWFDQPGESQTQPVHDPLTH